jgi:hypothetical protein
VNGTPVGTKVADANGFVRVTITVLSTLQLSVDDPVIVPAICGQNTVTATGFSNVANGNVTHTATFTLNCGPAVGGGAGPINNNNANNNENNNVNNNTNTVNVEGDTLNINTPAPQVVVLPGGGGGGSGQSQTQHQDQSQSQFGRIVHDIPKPHHAHQGKLAFTGATIIGMSLLALTAMLIGVFLVSSVKRRRQPAGRDEVTQDDQDEVVEPQLTLS